MPRFRNMLKKWLVDSYDYLGLVLVSSIAWFGIALGGFAAVVKAGGGHNPAVLLIGLAVFYILLAAPATAGVYSMAKKIAARDEPSLLDLLAGFGKLLVPSWVLGLAQVLVTFVIAVNIWFYVTHGGLAMRIIGVLFAYLMLLWVLSTMYHYPLLVEQRPGVVKILKRAMLLTMDNPAFTVGAFFVIILLTCFCTVTLLGLALLYAGMASIFKTCALRALFAKCELLLSEQGSGPGDGAGPTT